MNPEQWQQIKTVFHAARALPQRERDVYLREACAGNEALHAEVAALLELDDDADEFMQQPVLAETRFGSLLKEDQDLPQGQRIGPYEIERKIGEGGMGQVYRARDSRLGRPVAIKVLHEDFTLNAERVRRFQQEARAASALNHPNILTIYEVGEADGVHFIATEYIEGPTLRELLKRGELKLGEVLDIVIQAAQALEASHRAGIVHRDIKPENLMRRTDGFVKVLDFGLAKLTERPTDWATAEFSHFRTRPGVVMGTVMYMSPEQARGQEVDARSDVFSLGVVLFEILTGRLPFEGDSTSDVIVALLERVPKPLDSYISGLPAEFQNIVAHALQKQREDRYAGVSEMLADLRALKNDLEITAKLKRSGKAKIADTSLLEMRVGHSQKPVVRTTKQRQRGTTTRFSTVAVWIKNRPLVTLASALLLLVASLSVWAWRDGKLKLGAGDLNAIDSIAVLPFANASADPQMEYFPDGVTESIIRSLSQLPDLRVMARSTVFTYKGQRIDPRHVGETLRVRAVVIGQVLRQGDSLVIDVELVNATDGSHLWGDHYVRSMKDLLIVQDDIAREISAKLRLRLSGTQQQQLANRPTANPEAYQLYLLGRHHYYQFTYENGLKALDYFNKAIALDPTYALAYTGVADLYVDFSSQYMPPGEALPRVKEAARRALALDDTLAEAHYAMAVSHQYADWDWAGAEREFKRALALNPGMALAHSNYGALLGCLGRFDEAIAEIKRGQELDPLAAFAGDIACRVYLQARQFDRVIQESNRLQEVNPSFQFAIGARTQALSYQGKHAEAIKETLSSTAKNRHDAIQAYLGYFYARDGQRAPALKILRELEAQAKQRQVSPVYLSHIYNALGDKERTLQLLRQAYDAHSDHVMGLRVSPMYDSVRDDPRFQEMLRGMGLAKN